MIPLAHQTQPSDSGVNLDFLARSSSGVNVLNANITDNPSIDDGVFVFSQTPPLKNDEINNILTSSSSLESSSSSNTVTTEHQLPLTSASTNNALSRSRKSYFSRKDSTSDTQNKSKNDGKN